jgi:hypothetical protein
VRAACFLMRFSFIILYDLMVLLFVVFSGLPPGGFGP